jgi:YOP proteins translocation protein K (YscK)
VTTNDDLIRLQGTFPLLARKLYKFNFCPADYVHPSRRRRFDQGKLHDRVWETSRARAALSLHILRCLDVEDNPCFDPHDPAWPLLLLEPAQISRLQRHLAAVIFNPLIRHSVLHDDVVMWRTRLGVDAYKFALNGFNLLPMTAWEQTEYEVSQVEAVSYGLIEVAMASAAYPVRSRAVLKLPEISAPPNIEVESARRLVNALMSILEPEWRSYFSAIRH